jgi:translation initiation factor IF-2
MNFEKKNDKNKSFIDKENSIDNAIKNKDPNRAINKTLKIKTIDIDSNKLQNSALNALSSRSKNNFNESNNKTYGNNKKNSLFSNNQNKNYNRTYNNKNINELNLEEYQLRKEALKKLIESRERNKTDNSLKDENPFIDINNFQKKNLLEGNKEILEKKIDDKNKNTSIFLDKNETILEKNIFNIEVKNNNSKEEQVDKKILHQNNNIKKEYDINFKKDNLINSDKNKLQIKSEKFKDSDKYQFYNKNNENIDLNANAINANEKIEKKKFFKKNDNEINAKSNFTNKEDNFKSRKYSKNVTNSGNLDDYLDSLVLENQDALNKINNLKDNTFKKHNNKFNNFNYTGDVLRKDKDKINNKDKNIFEKKDNQDIDLNIFIPKQAAQYNSQINHSALIAKRNKFEEDEKKEKFNQDKKISKPIGLQNKRNMNFRAAFLNSIDNEDVLYNKDGSIRSSKKKNNIKSKNENNTSFVVKEVLIKSENNLRELANSINMKVFDLIKVLSKLDKKIKYKENSIIDQELCELLILEIGHIPIIESFITIEKLIQERIDLANNFTKKPPVVTIMGHVDHGKTSLLDSMRRRFKKTISNVTDSESGGITQHIGAYQIETKNGSLISFIDTPGHEAFTAIRARGSLITDIVILVVAADDGIMPQTIEAIKHAQSAKVPIIVAINKIDAPGANIQQILNQLIQYDIITEENGGDVIAVPISAKFETNLDKLEDAILLVAEMQDLKADETIDAIGTIIETKITQSKGPCATVLIQHGILKVGDFLITNDKFCKIRSMSDENLSNINFAKPAKAVEIFGFDEIPSVGQKFLVFKTEKLAKNNLQQIKNDFEKQKLLKEKKEELLKLSSQSGSKDTNSKMRNIFDLFSSAIKNKNIDENKDSDSNVKKELNFIIKADVSGTIDAVKYSLEKLNNENEKINLRIIYSATGPVSESDIMLAKSSSAIICGFNVGAQSNIRNLIEKENLLFKTYTIIYQLIDDIKSIINNELKPKTIEKIIAKAFVKQTFDISKVGLIAGCYVKEGSIIQKNSFVRIKRKDDIIAENILIKELKKGKENVKEVTSGLECGIFLQDYDDILKDDIFEIYQMIDND